MNKTIEDLHGDIISIEKSSLSENKAVLITFYEDGNENSMLLDKSKITELYETSLEILDEK